MEEICEDVVVFGIPIPIELVTDIGEGHRKDRNVAVELQVVHLFRSHEGAGNRFDDERKQSGEGRCRGEKSLEAEERLD